VSVVFTHRDGGVASRPFANLQRRYPELLGHHRGELQPVDLGSKGVWAPPCGGIAVGPPGSLWH
jgi:hypothetical protein